MILYSSYLLGVMIGITFIYLEAFHAQNWIKTETKVMGNKAKCWPEELQVLSLLRLWKDDGIWLFTVHANKVTCFFQAQTIHNHHTHLFLLAKCKKTDEQKIFLPGRKIQHLSFPGGFWLCPWKYSWCRWMKPWWPDLW